MIDRFVFPTAKGLIAADVGRLGLSVMLVNGYTPAASHTTTANVAEASGAGYEAGGVALKNVTQAEDGDDIVIRADSVVWPDSKITADGCVFYAAKAGNKLLCYQSFGESLRSSNHEFRLSWPDGIIGF